MDREYRKILFELKKVRKRANRYRRKHGLPKSAIVIVNITPKKSENG